MTALELAKAQGLDYLSLLKCVKIFYDLLKRLNFITLFARPKSNVQALRARGLLPGGHSEDEDDSVSGGSDGLAASEAIVEITKQVRT